MICNNSVSQLTEISMEMRTLKNNEFLESMNASHKSHCVIQKTTTSATPGKQLLSAAKNGKDEEIRQLIREGVNIVLQDTDDQNTTSLAAEGGHCRVE